MGILTSLPFWIIMIVMVLFIGFMLTAAYNDDKTSGL